jgi:agmatinase
VADAGDITCNPFSIDEAIKQIEVGATDLLKKVGGIISLGWRPHNCCTFIKSNK